MPDATHERAGRPAFPTTDSIEQLHEHRQIHFAKAATDFRGATLGEFQKQV